MGNFFLTLFLHLSPSSSVCANWFAQIASTGQSKRLSEANLQRFSSMADSKSGPSSTVPDKDVKAPNVIERAKEEIEAILHTNKSHHHHHESHGTGNDIDENTPISDVKAPNVFERIQEEIEALVQTIHPKKETERSDETGKIESKPEQANALSQEKVKHVKTPKLIQKAKEEFEAIMHKSPHRHHKETHGTSDDIDESTPISEVKGPNVFERAKEEIEAIVHAIHPKKASGNDVSMPEKKGGFQDSIGKGLEKA
ncbi:hypothetical protein NMG60_11013597 [Bertholletia excelsa]